MVAVEKSEKKSVEFLLYSAFDESFLKSFFKKTLELSVGSLESLSKKGVLVPLKAFAENCEFLKQGVVTNVGNGTRSLTQIWVETKSRTEDLRDCLLPNGWKEIFGNLG